MNLASSRRIYCLRCYFIYSYAIFFMDAFKSDTIVW
jgi:hypothetical protein